jgi:hypothetical protein
MQGIAEVAVEWPLSAVETAPLLRDYLVECKPALPEIVVVP